MLANGAAWAETCNTYTSHDVDEVQHDAGDFLFCTNWQFLFAPTGGDQSELERAQAVTASAK